MEGGIGLTKEEWERLDGIRYYFKEEEKEIEDKKKKEEEEKKRKEEEKKKKKGRTNKDWIRDFKRKSKGKLEGPLKKVTDEIYRSNEVHSDKLKMIKEKIIYIADSGDDFDMHYYMDFLVTFSYMLSHRLIEYDNSIYERIYGDFKNREEKTGYFFDSGSAGKVIGVDGKDGENKDLDEVKTDDLDIILMEHFVNFKKLNIKTDGDFTEDKVKEALGKLFDKYKAFLKFGVITINDDTDDQKQQTEIEVGRKLIDIVYNKETPHISPIFVGHYIDRIDDRSFKKNNDLFVKIKGITKNKEKLKDRFPKYLITKWYNVDKFNKYSMLFNIKYSPNEIKDNDGIVYGDLNKFIENFYTSNYVGDATNKRDRNSIYGIVGILIQILYTLLVFDEYSIFHNDLHLKNIKLEKFSGVEPKKIYYVYNYKNEVYLIKITTYFNVKLFDYDLSYIENTRFRKIKYYYFKQFPKNKKKIDFFTLFYKIWYTMFYNIYTISDSDGNFLLSGNFKHDKMTNNELNDGDFTHSGYLLNLMILIFDDAYEVKDYLSLIFKHYNLGEIEDVETMIEGLNKIKVFNDNKVVFNNRVTNKKRNFSDIFEFNGGKLWKNVNIDEVINRMNDKFTIIKMIIEDYHENGNETGYKDDYNKDNFTITKLQEIDEAYINKINYNEDTMYICSNVSKKDVKFLKKEMEKYNKATDEQYKKFCHILMYS